MAYLKILGSGLIRVTGNYGYETSTVEGLAAYSTIDATGASRIVSNSANQNPDADTSYSEGSGFINGCHRLSCAPGVTKKARQETPVFLPKWPEMAVYPESLRVA